MAFIDWDTCNLRVRGCAVIDDEDYTLRACELKEIMVELGEWNYDYDNDSSYIGFESWIYSEKNVFEDAIIEHVLNQNK